MMGWAMLAAVALAAALILWLIGYPRRLWAFAATALMLGAAGYAWQGSPTLGGAPVTPDAPVAGSTDPELVAMRDAMYGIANYAHAYFVAADAMARRGNHDAAVTVMLGAVREQPRNGSLWAGLGLAMAQHDGNVISPPAQLAFDRALELWPDHPGPAFFYGLAQIRAGDFAEGHRWWRRALELTPEDASYHGAIATRVALLERLLDQLAREQGSATPPAQ